MNASIMSGSIAGPAQMTCPSTAYPTAYASPSNAAVFADRIERLQKQSQAPAEETDAAEIFADDTQAGMPAARSDRRRMPQEVVPVAAAIAPPMSGRPFTDPIEAAAASAIDPSMIAASTLNPSTIAASTNDVRTASAPSDIDASAVAPEEIRDIDPAAPDAAEIFADGTQAGMPAARGDRRRMPRDAVPIAAAIAPPVPGRPFTDPIEAAAASAIDPSMIDASTLNPSTIAASTNDVRTPSAPSDIDASAAAPEVMRDMDPAAPSAPDHAGAADTAFVPQAGKTSSQLTLRGDMQALLGEFEASIRHFENAGGRWIGNARIVFHSDVLNGASVLITGNEKTLDVLIRQSVLSPLNTSFGRQEKQFSEELTRRLGRSVTLHIAHVSNQQAAGDAEAQ